MKRKGLTIFFFSVMALAVTPRAMQHFKNYVSAAENRAQTELLHLLVSFGAPAAETQPAPQASQPSVCAAPAVNKAPASTIRPRERAAANALQPVAQNRTFEFAFQSLPLAPADFERQAVKPSDHISTDVETRHAFEKVNYNVDALTQKSESIATLLRAGKLNEKEAACKLEQQLIAFAKLNKRTPPVVRMRLAREAAAVPAPQPAFPAQPATPDSQHAPENSMR